MSDSIPQRLTGRRPILVYVVILLGAVVLAYDGDLSGNLDLYHEGDRMGHLDALFDGKLPFRDIYVQHGLGEDIVKPLLACRLFGESVESVRRLGQNSYIYRGYLPPLGLGATILAAAILLRRPGRAAWVGLALLTCLYEVSDRMIFGFLAVAAAGAYINTRRRSWLVGTGACAALAGLYSLEVGLYVSVAVIVWLVIDGLIGSGDRAGAAGRVARQLMLTGGGFLLVAGPFLGWCAARGIAGDFFRNVYIQLVMRPEVLAGAYVRPQWNEAQSIGGNLFVNSLAILLFYVLPALYGASVIVAIAARGLQRSFRSRLLLVGLVGSCFWASVVGRADFWHLSVAVAPFMILVGLCIEAVQRRRPRRWASVSLLALPALVVAALLYVGQGGAIGRTCFGHESRFLPDELKRRGRRLAPLDLPRVGDILVEPPHAQYVASLVGYITTQTTPDETILDLSDQGLLYFLCDRRSPTRFHLISHVGHSRLRRTLANEVLAHDRLPRYAILRDDHALDPADPIDAIVLTHYEPEVRFAGLFLWRCADPIAHRRQQATPGPSTGGARGADATAGP